MKDHMAAEACFNELHLDINKTIMIVSSYVK